MNCPEDCHDKFEVLFDKIDKIDEALRGNGKVGLATRVDRLEQAEKTRSKIIWMLLSAVIIQAVSAALPRVLGG